MLNRLSQFGTGATFGQEYIVLDMGLIPPNRSTFSMTLMAHLGFQHLTFTTTQGTLRLMCRFCKMFSMSCFFSFLHLVLILVEKVVQVHSVS